MKVVLFCGGLGMRLRDYNERLPKPLIDVGPRPIVWHLMKYYAHYGHREFILCLGHGGRAIKEYFLTYDESTTNDFVLSNGGQERRLPVARPRRLEDHVRRHRHQLADRRTTAARPGTRRGRPVVPRELRRRSLGSATRLVHRRGDSKRDKIATFITVPAPHTFHIVHSDTDQHVEQLKLVAESTVRCNAGFFVFKSEIFDYLEPGDELVDRPFTRLIGERQLIAVPHDGFWRNMDTFKDKVLLDEIESAGRPPWRVWLDGGRASTDADASPAPRRTASWRHAAPPRRRVRATHADRRA